MKSSNISNRITLRLPLSPQVATQSSSKVLLVSVQYSSNMQSRLTLWNTGDNQLIFKLKLNEERYSANSISGINAISGIIAPHRHQSIEIKLTDKSSQEMFQALFLNGQSYLDSLSKGDEILIKTCVVPPCVSEMLMPFITIKDELINWCVWNHTMTFNNNLFVDNVQLSVQRMKVNVHLIASLPTADIPQHWRDAIEEHMLNIANKNTADLPVSAYDKIKSLEEELELKQKLVSSTKKKLDDALAGYDVALEQYDKKASAVQKLEEELESKKQLVSSTKKKLDNTRAGLGVAREQYNKKASAVRKLEEELKTVTSKLDAERNAVSQEQVSMKKIQTLQSQVSSLSAQLEQANDNASTSDQKLKGCQAEVDSMQTTIMELSTDIEAKEMEVSTLKNDLVAVKEEARLASEYAKRGKLTSYYQK